MEACVLLPWKQPFPQIEEPTAKALKLQLKAEVVPVLCLGHPFPRTSGLFEGTPLAAYKGQQGLIVSPLPIEVGGKQLLLLELFSDDQETEVPYEPMLASSLLLAQVAVVNLDSFNAESAAAFLLTLLASPRCPLAKVVWVVREPWRAERLLASTDLHCESEVFTVRPEETLKEETLRLVALVSTVRPIDFLQLIWKFPERYSQAKQDLLEGSLEDDQWVAALFEACVADERGLEGVFKANVGSRTGTSVRKMLGMCRSFDRDYRLLLGCVNELSSDLVSAFHEGKLQSLLKHFPRNRETLAPLFSVLAEIKLRNQTRNTRSKWLRSVLGLSMLALASAAFVDEWTRTAVLTVGLGGLLSVAVLRDSKKPEIQGAYPAFAVDVLVSSQKVNVSPRAQALIYSLPETVAMLLCIGVNNQDVGRFANALAAACFPYSLLSERPFQTPLGTQLLPFCFRDSGKGLLVAVNFQGRNDSRECTFQLKLAISLFSKSAKTILFHGSDPGRPEDIRQDSWLKNLVEMSLMRGEDTKESLLFVSSLGSSWRSVRQSFEAWHAPVSTGKVTDFKEEAERLAAELQYLQKVQTTVLAACIAESLAGL